MPRVSPEGGARLPISVIENIDHRWSFDRKPWKLTNRPRDGRSNAYSNACTHDRPPMEEAGELVSEVATLYFEQQFRQGADCGSILDQVYASNVA